MDSENNIFSFIFAIMILLFIATSNLILNYTNEKQTTCIAQEKWIKRNEKTDLYLIKCGNEVYQISDLFWKGKFNSSDLYAKISPNKKYKITTTGYRIPFLSRYKNINKIIKKD